MYTHRIQEQDSFIPNHIHGSFPISGLSSQPDPVSGSGPRTDPDPCSGSGSDITSSTGSKPGLISSLISSTDLCQDAGSSSSRIRNRDGHSNILLDFFNDEDDSDLSQGNILVSFDSDKECILNSQQVESDSETESYADDEEDEVASQDSDSSNGDHHGPMTLRMPGEKFTEIDFDFLDEEWLHDINESTDYNSLTE